MRAYLAHVSALVLVGCSPEVPDGPDEGRSVAEYDRMMAEFPKPQCDPNAVADYPRSAAERPLYFPTDHLKPSMSCNGAQKCFPPIMDIEFDWFTEQLRAADEPSIYEASLKSQSGDHRSYRVTVLPTFEHPVIIRIEIVGGEGKLIAKEMSGEGGYEPEGVSRHLTRTLTAEEVERFEKLVTLLRIAERSTANCVIGLDGTVSVFEFLDSNGYKVIHRWQVDGPMAEYQDHALSLVGWPDLQNASPAM